MSVAVENIVYGDPLGPPLGITQLAAAQATGIPQSRLSEILAGRRSITADTAARLGRFFQVAAEDVTGSRRRHVLRACCPNGRSVELR